MCAIASGSQDRWKRLHRIICNYLFNNIFEEDKINIANLKRYKKEPALYNRKD